MRTPGLIALVKEAFRDWQKDKATRVAAALAYYAVFSLAPLLVVVIAVAGLAFGQEAAQGHIMGQIDGLVGSEAAVMIEQMIAAARHPAAGVAASIIGLGTLLLGAAGVFGLLQDALNTIWEAPPRRGGLLRMLRDRFLSFSMLLGTGFLLLISLVISAALSAVETGVNQWLPLPPLALEGVHLVLSLGGITVLFALIYQVLPDVDIAWRDVWVGALITSLLFVVGKSLIGVYLGRGSFTSAFGAAGSLVVILLWVYYSAQILLFGAEVTQVYAQRRGARAEQAARRHVSDAPIPIGPAPTRRGITAGIPAVATGTGSSPSGWTGFLFGLLLGYQTVRRESRANRGMDDVG